MSKYQKLAEFKKRHGHCVVPRSWGELGKWVFHQRERIAFLPPRKRKLLDDLGFDWTPLDTVWNQRLSELKEFKKRFGHSRVPENWSENPRLAHWVAHQRQAGRRGTLARDRISRLNAIGFFWGATSTGCTKKFRLEGKQ
jgi:hypothetical protein